MVFGIRGGVTENMNVLLIGGAGFIGANLTKRLCLEGYNVTVYDRSLKSKSLPNCEFDVIEGDFLSDSNFDEILEKQDVVIHLISTVSPYSSMLNVASSYKDDVVKTLEILERAKNKGLKKVIFLSSGGTVYGNSPDSDLLNEDMNSYPLNHYGVMKLTIEKILLLYNQLYNMENVVLRVANPYGPGQNPQKKIGAISVFLDSILKGRTVTLYGDGSTVRDYIEISDVCEAIICAIRYQHETNINPVFNVGTGIGTSIMEVIRSIEQITNIKADINFEEMREIDVRKNVLDPRRSREYLNFNYRINVDEGIRRLLIEHNKHMGQ